MRWGGGVRDDCQSRWQEVLQVPELMSELRRSFGDAVRLLLVL